MMDLLKAYKRYDPAARSRLEVFLLYPGVKALFLHRIAHLLYKLKLYFLARTIGELSRFLTGIEIHPGARIGKRLIIDHGTGLVIGETAVIGNDVILYQGATLGGTDLERKKRHPTIEDQVVVGAGAKVLGDVVIGKGSRVGANSVIIESCPPYSTVVGIPAKIIRKGIERGEELRHDKIKE